MSREASTHTQINSTNHPLSQGSILQRKCTSCGQHKMSGGICNQCTKEKSPNSATVTPLKMSRDFSQIPITSNAAPAPIQPKLVVGHPNDKYEQEADRVAEKVMRMPEPQVQRQAEPTDRGITIQRISAEKEEDMVQTKLAEGVVQRKCAACEEEKTLQRTEMEEEEETLQTKSEGGGVPAVTPSIQSGVDQLRQGGGTALPASTRSFMEPRFGHDFSNVKIHAGSQAANLSKSVNARAFTVGQDIFFNRGEFQPNSSSGMRLLAHELTHVVQQKGASQFQTQLPNQKNHLVASSSNQESWVQRYPNHAGEVFLMTLADSTLQNGANEVRIGKKTVSQLVNEAFWTAYPEMYGKKINNENVSDSEQKQTYIDAWKYIYRLYEKKYKPKIESGSSGVEEANSELDDPWQDLKKTLKSSSIEPFSDAASLSEEELYEKLNQIEAELSYETDPNRIEELLNYRDLLEAAEYEISQADEANFNFDESSSQLEEPGFKDILDFSIADEWEFFEKREVEPKEWKENLYEETLYSGIAIPQIGGAVDITANVGSKGNFHGFLGPGRLNDIQFELSKLQLAGCGVDRYYPGARAIQEIREALSETDTDTNPFEKLKEECPNAENFDFIGTANIHIPASVLVDLELIADLSASASVGFFIEVAKLSAGFEAKADAAATSEFIGAISFIYDGGNLSFEYDGSIGGMFKFNFGLKAFLELDVIGYGSLWRLEWDLTEGKFFKELGPDFETDIEYENNGLEEPPNLELNLEKTLSAIQLVSNLFQEADSESDLIGSTNITGGMSEPPVGSKSDPFEIYWPKPPSLGYPHIYLGGLVSKGKKITQSEFRQAYNLNEEIGDHPVEIYEPHAKQTLPGGEEIGLRDGSVGECCRVFKGQIVGPMNKATVDKKTPGGDKINKILRRYGFIPEEMNGDHIWEIQLGGKDIKENLWPLEASQNSSGGSKINNLYAYYKGKPYAQLKNLKKDIELDPTKEYYFKIKDFGYDPKDFE